MPTRMALNALPVLLALAGPAWAQSCNVPAQRPTIQSAALDPACTTINVAAGTRVESVGVSRSVAIVGAGTAATVIQGRVIVRGTGTVLDLVNLTVDGRGAGTGCYTEALRVLTGATTRPLAVAVLGGAGAAAPCPLFADSFDFGN